MYLGTPEIAVPPLRALHDNGFDIALVITRADKRRGRGGAPVPSPVKAAAAELGLPVTTDVGAAVEVGADLGVVVAFGRIIAPEVLAKLPMINLHFSRLPRWRGAAPVERAILAGDTETAVDVMAVDETLDTGAIYAERVLDIGPDETADELRARLVEAGTELLVQLLRDGLGVPRPQEGTPTYADKIDPAELHLDWTRPAIELHRVVRIGNAWTEFRGRRLKIWRTRLEPAGRPAGGSESTTSQPEGLAPGELDGCWVGTGAGLLELVEVQPEGKARQAARAWLNGARPRRGEKLGS